MIFQEKARVVSGSPQSTLSGIGSWSGRSGGSSEGSPNGSTRVPSPTTTPFPAGNDAWEVLYEAAGQVARLKMNNDASKFGFQNRGVLGGHPPPIAAENRAPNFFPNQNLSHVSQHLNCLLKCANAFCFKFFIYLFQFILFVGSVPAASGEATV